MEHKELEKYLVSIEDTKKRVKEADEALPEDVKTKYPIKPITEIKEKHKNRWIALLTTDVDENLWPTAGRVVANAGKYDRPELEKRIKPLEVRLKRAMYIRYMGPYDSFDGNIENA